MLYSLGINLKRKNGGLSLHSNGYLLISPLGNCGDTFMTVLVEHSCQKHFQPFSLAH